MKKRLKFKILDSSIVLRSIPSQEELEKKVDPKFTKMVDERDGKGLKKRFKIIKRKKEEVKKIIKSKI